jgi:hypothetical protein
MPTSSQSAHQREFHGIDPLQRRSHGSKKCIGQQADSQLLSPTQSRAKILAPIATLLFHRTSYPIDLIAQLSCPEHEPSLTAASTITWRAN